MNSQTIAHSREVPVVDSFDVIVAGAGPAGIMAAVAAAASGARTLLIERYGFVGGALTNALVAPSQVFSVFGRPIVGGFPRQLMDRLASSGNAIFPELGKTFGDWRGLTYWDPEILGTRFDPEAFKNEALMMLLEHGVNIRLHTFVVDCIRQSGTVVAYNKSGYEAFQAKVIVDCSGDADLAEMAGYEFQKGEPGDEKALQPPTLMMRLGGVDYEVARQYRPSFPEIIETATKNGDLDLKREDLLFYRGTVRAGECLINCSRVYKIDGTDVDDLTRAEIEARRQNIQLLKFFRKYVPGFQNAYLIDMGPQGGIRETRRIVGEYTLTGDDVLEGKQFPDTVALSYWPIDQHRADGAGTVLDFPAPGVLTRVPYRCLIPLGSESFLVAGRSISATREAMASIRISGTIMAVGQAAGTAAALAVREDVSVREVSIEKLQGTLKSQGAIIS